ETVPGADDFWGEGAAAVHGAIQPSARHAKPPAADPPTRARPRPPVARRAWGFAIGPAPRSTVIGDVPVRPRTLAAAVIVACLIAIGAIGLAEGGARRSGPRRQANA